MESSAASPAAASATEEWTVVTRNDKRHVVRRKGRQRSKPAHIGIEANDLDNNDNISGPIDEAVLSKGILPQQLEEAVGLLQRSDFYRDLKIQLSQEDLVFSRIVCYGLGNFSKQHATTTSVVFSAPFWQLALLCRLAKDFTAADSLSQTTERRIIFYDPCTLPLEREFLAATFPGIDILDDNHRGKICLVDEQLLVRKEDGAEEKEEAEVVLFFMPHCPMLLYEHVIWSHWDHFVKGKAIILGNSLHAYGNRLRLSSTEQSHPTRPKVDEITTSAATSALPPCLATICSSSPLSISDHVRERLVDTTREDLTTMPGYFERAFNDLYFTRCDRMLSAATGRNVDRPPERVAQDDEDDGELV